jgi:hypothetical protein
MLLDGSTDTKIISLMFLFVARNIATPHFCDLQNKILNFTPAFIWNATYY